MAMIESDKPPQMPDYGDRPEQKSFPANVSGTDTELRIGNCAIALFRHRPNMDYLAIQQEEGWIFCFDKQELIHWMGGIALTPTDRENIRRADSQLGSFYSRYGWNPDVVIEDYPNQNELDVYVEFLINKDMQGEQLTLPETDDDGA